MEVNKKHPHLSVLECFHRYLKIYELSNPAAEIARELGIPERTVMSWKASSDGFPVKKDLIFWKLAYFLIKKGFCPFETVYFQPSLRLVLELLFGGVHIDDILRAVERDREGLVRLLNKPKRLTPSQVSKITLLKSRFVDRKEIARLEEEILDLMRQLEKKVSQLNGDREKVLARIKQGNQKMYAFLAESIARQRWPR